jgi:NADH:ubiquinone oxidoreductase subunit F (NADH-binding)/(2Fe-2S) ferredoxin
MRKLKSISELEELRKKVLSHTDRSKPCIAICGGTGCHNQGNREIVEAFRNEIKKEKLQEEIIIRETGCQGFCEQGPMVLIQPEKVCYTKVTLEDIPEIVSSVAHNNNIERLLYTNPENGEKIVHEDEIPFYKNQLRLIGGDNNKIDPRSIEDYIAIGGYSALIKAMQTMSPEQVIAEVKKSNIRGRSGNGFAAGRKWEACLKAEAETKYIICNCHEGDPGAFVDRRMMEANPHSILEGMLIGAFAMQANEGFVFVGDEFPVTVRNIERAIEQAEEYGLLGQNILGSGLNFTVKVTIDGGNYVCGESTALMASMEGRVGEPIAKYDHATEHGLWAKPTDLNNLQTWANIPFIISQGADEYIKTGTERSKGTRSFSLSGSIKNIGIVEVPMGTPFRKIVYDIGGGTRNGKRFKALQVGGPMGGFIPESQLDLVVDFDELTKAGLTLGPGLIAIDESTCIVDMVKFLLTFLSNESCGKCTSCREGLRQMIKIMDRITEGKGKKTDLDLLEAIAKVQKSAALCALGKGASNTLSSALKNYRDEFEAHITEKRCPAGTCKILTPVTK